MAFWQIILIIVESICLVLLITLNIYRRKQLNKQASSNVDKDVISQKSPEVSKFTVQKSTINPSNTLSEDIYNSSNIYAQIRKHNNAITAAEKEKNLSRPAIETEKLVTSSNKPQGNTQNRVNDPIVSKESLDINYQRSKIVEKQEKIGGSNTQEGNNISNDKIIPAQVVPKQVVKPSITARGIAQQGIAPAPQTNLKSGEPISHRPVVTPKKNIPKSGNGARSVYSDLVMELKTSRLVTIYSDNKLTKVRGIPFEQFLVLGLMKILGKNANATELGKYLNKSTNTLSTILDRMEKRGLLKKTRDKLDRRLVWAVMTPMGREKLAATTKASLAVFQKLSSCFSKEELVQFDTLLEKLINNTDKLVNTPNRRKKPKPTWD